LRCALFAAGFGFAGALLALDLDSGWEVRGVDSADFGVLSLVAGCETGSDESELRILGKTNAAISARTMPAITRRVFWFMWRQLAVRRGS